MVGWVSLKPLGEALLQLKQMAVAQDRQRRSIGKQLLVHAEGWAGAAFQLMTLNARIGIEGFYAAHGYVVAGSGSRRHNSAYQDD